MKNEYRLNRNKHRLENRNRMLEEISTDWKTETECRKKKIRIEKKRMRTLERG